MILMRKTKIICTLGPAVDDEAMLKKLILNGMNCARLNFSHGTHAQQKERMDRVKKLRKELNIPLPILLDTKGPEIRLRDFENGSILVKEGDIFTFSSDYDLIGNQTIVGLTYPDLALYVMKGTKILIDDGKVQTEVIDIVNKDVVVKILNPGKLSNHKSINIPNVIVDMEYLSEVDKSDVLFGISQDIDYIAASFVRRKQDVLDLRKFLHENGGDSIKIISKIENTEGISNMDDIIEASDGVMVARGDMGVEVPFKNLPAIQKDMISKCYRAGKHVVTATQMLDSMQQNPRPTRAEVSDVANAVYDRTTAIMLSGESAAGLYPIESVSAMSEIALAAEETINYENRFKNDNLDLGNDFVSAICNSAVKASYQIKAKAIICVTRNGLTALRLASYRPNCPIIAVCVNEKACRQLNLAWNVYPVYSNTMETTDEIFINGIEKSLATGLIQKGDKVVITGSSAIGEQSTDMFKLHVI